MMKRPKILVTGATGKTGAGVVEELLRKGWPVRALVRRVDVRSKALENLGAEVIAGDIFDPRQLSHALAGITRAYYCSFFDPYLIQSAAAFTVAATDSNLEVLVSLGQWLGSPSHPSLATRQTWLMERLFATLPGIAYTRVNPGYFADNYLRVMPYAAHLGMFPTVTGDSKNAPPSNEDIARVAAGILMDPERHEGKMYRPTGPELLSADDMVQILGRILRRKVTRIDLPFWMLERAARLQQTPAFQMSGLRDYIQDHKQGAFAFSGPTDHVLEVTGRPAEDFEVTARRYAARADVQPTLGNWFRTFADFMKIPLVPGYDLRNYDRNLQAPAAPDPKFAMQDAAWMAEHTFSARQPASVRARV